MLPKYHTPVLTMEKLSDDVLTSALERREYLTVSLTTVRAVCYHWMNTSAVPLVDLADFLQHLPSWEVVDPNHPLLVVELLCKEVRDILNGEEVQQYLPRLEPQRVKDAMAQTGVSMDAEQMSLLLANLAVGGLTAITEECSCVLSEWNISAEKVVEVANHYKS